MLGDRGSLHPRAQSLPPRRSRADADGVGTALAETKVPSPLFGASWWVKHMPTPRKEVLVDVAPHCIAPWDIPAFPAPTP